MAERFMPRAQEIYRHFKGKLYQVLAIAEHTETGEQLVIYQAMYGEFKVYARPLEMFIGPVDRIKYPDADQEFRFQLQGPDAQRQCMAYRSVSGTTCYAESSQSDSKNAGSPESAPILREATELAQSVQQDNTATMESEASETSEVTEASEVTEVSKASEASKVTEVSETSDQEQLALDPLVLEFLDANTYEERLNLLAALHHRITNEMITTMALCCDLEVEGDDVEQRYEELKQCLLMKDRFEIKRLR